MSIHEVVSEEGEKRQARLCCTHRAQLHVLSLVLVLIFVCTCYVACALTGFAMIFSNIGVSLIVMIFMGMLHRTTL
jgi:hypothetical protein